MVIHLSMRTLDNGLKHTACGRDVLPHRASSDATITDCANCKRHLLRMSHFAKAKAMAEHRLTQKEK